MESVRVTRRYAKQWTNREVKRLPWCSTQQALTNGSHKQGVKPKHAKKDTPEFSLIESIHASEKRVLGEQDSAHTFEVSFVDISHKC